jgi:CdiI immunity protein
VKLSIPLNSPLGQFLAGTFHQDWMGDFQQAQDAVIDYLKRSDQRLVAEVATQLKEWLVVANAAGDVDVVAALSGVCDYWPPAGDTKSEYLNWLREVGEQLDEFLTRSN